MATNPTPITPNKTPSVISSTPKPTSHPIGLVDWPALEFPELSVDIGLENVDQLRVR